MGTAIGKKQCPACAKRGGDTRQDNLVIYDDGSAYCFACNYYELSNGNHKQNNKEALITMKEISAASVLNKRGVSEKTVKDYDVKVVQHPKTGELFVKFPFVDINGSEESYQLRAINALEGTLSREIINKKGGSLTNPFFGWNTFRRNKKAKTIVVCEGCTDTLCAASALSHRDDIAVVGLLSASFARKAAAFMVRYLEKYNIVLALDDDEAGKRATTTIYEYVQKHNPKIKLCTINFPGSLKGKAKDICDLVALGENLEELINNSSSLLATDVLDHQQITKEFMAYLNNISEGDYIQFEFSPSLTDAVKLLPGKLISVVGDAGKGKSTLVEHMILSALNQQKKVFMISAEMRAAEVALKLVRTITGTNYYDRQTLHNLSPEEKEQLADICSTITKNLFLFGRFGQCEVDEIDQKIYELEAAGNKPELLVIDHILAISAEGTTEELEHITKSLKGLAEKHALPIIVLCHTRKPQAQVSRNKIYRPSLSDIYNNGAIARYSDLVLGVALDPAKRLTYVETLKLERMGGQYIDIRLKFNCWRLVEVDENENEVVCLDEQDSEFEEEESYSSDEPAESDADADELPALASGAANHTPPQNDKQEKLAAHPPQPAPLPHPLPQQQPQVKQQLPQTEPQPEPAPDHSQEEEEDDAIQFARWHKKAREAGAWWHYHLFSGNPII